MGRNGPIPRGNTVIPRGKRGKGRRLTSPGETPVIVVGLTISVFVVLRRSQFRDRHVAIQARGGLGCQVLWIERGLHELHSGQHLAHVRCLAYFRNRFAQTIDASSSMYQIFPNSEVHRTSPVQHTSNMRWRQSSHISTAHIRQK